MWIVRGTRKLNTCIHIYLYKYLFSFYINISLFIFLFSAHSNLSAIDFSILNCKICPQRWFPNKQSWTEHHLTYHKTEVVALCEKCCKTFKSHNGYQYHQQIYHSSADDKHPCTICGKTFISEYKLGLHQRVHSSEKPFKCKKCPSSYKYKQDLQKHEVKHKKWRRTYLFIGRCGIQENWIFCYLYHYSWLQWIFTQLSHIFKNWNHVYFCIFHLLFIYLFV